MTAPVSRETPPTPAAAAGVFSDQLPLVERYAGWLADAGTVRGLIGPREVPRLWDRHLLNCAVVTDVVAEGSSVCDVGSGAGLPGLVMALRRSDLRVTLLEPLLRRTKFLDEVVADLGLSNVEVVRGRAEELHGRREFDVVTSRAVAALDKLLAWSLPLSRSGGEVLAMKGGSAAEEVTAAAPALERMGVTAPPEIVELGGDTLPVPTVVVRVVAPVGDRVGLSSARRPRSSGSSRRTKPRRR